MSDAAVHPFESIEDTQEFIALLEGAIAEALHEVEGEVQRARSEHHDRRAEAFSLALYKLRQLTVHVGKSRRIVNDLRSIRRLLASERELRAIPR